MLRDIKFFDKYYVGFQKDRYSSEETFRMLGFATPNTGDYAFKKRKATVDGWSQKDLTALDMENKPTHGFRIGEAVTRYSTDNKKFRVEDPRGFELEITVYNLFDIITKHTIVQGTIMEPMVWGRSGQDNYLISSASAEYKHHVSGPKVTSLDAGVWFTNRAKNVLYRFEGRLAYNLLGAQLYRKDPQENNYNYYHYRHGNSSKPRTDWNGVTTKIKTVVNRKQDKPAFVYTEYHLDEDGKTLANPCYYREDVDTIQKARIVIRKTEIKDLIPIDVSEVKCDFAKGYILPLGEKLQEVDYSYHHRNNDEIVDRTNYTVDMNMSAGTQTVPVLFKTKKESMESVYTAEELLNYFQPIKHNDRSYYGANGRPDGYYGKITYAHEDSALTDITKEDE